MDPETAGQRIARARRRRGLSQTVLAGLVGRSESWLSQVERGRRGIDSHAVLMRLAEVLRIDIEEIITPGAGSEDGQHAFPAAPLIEQAMMRYGTLGASADPGAQPGHQMGHLRAMARSAYQGYQATRYEATGRLLPRLIRGIDARGRSVRRVPLMPPLQVLPVRAGWSGQVHQGYTSQSAALAYNIKDTTLTGNTGVVTVTLADAAASLTSESLTYSAGRWGFVPNDLSYYRYGSVKADIAAAKAAGYCASS